MIHLYDGNNWLRREMESMSSIRHAWAKLRTTQALPIMVWDGAKGSQSRKDIYPQYKANRLPTAESFYQSMHLFKEILTHTRCVQVEVPGYEGDDTLAAIRLRAMPEPVHIHTTDVDMLALPDTVIDRPSFKIPAHLIRVYKTLVGDTSDNIKGVKGFGEKTWAKCDPEELLLWARAGFHLGAIPASIPKSCTTWVQDNHDILLACWKITGFRDMPVELLDKHTKVGVPNNDRVEALLKEFLL